MKKEKMSLDVVNPQAAGIDVGSRSHYVASGMKTSKNLVCTMKT